MSEYTTLYLRKKGEPLMKYRSLSSEETFGLTKEEYLSLQEEIEEEKQFIKRYEEELIVLENRIRAADVKLYDKIDQEIFETKATIKDCLETLEELQFLFSRFEFVANMMKDEDNVNNYELIYTKS